MEPRHADTIAAAPAASDPDLEALLTQFDTAIAALPAALKEPLILTSIEGLSHKEAGRVLNLSPKAVEMRVYRAKQALMQMLPDQSGLSEDAP